MPGPQYEAELRTEVRRMTKSLIAFFLTFLLGACAPIALADAASANTALQQGRADDAIAALEGINTAEAHNLRCRVYLSEDLTDQAISECEAAVNAAPGNSSYHLFLGHAYGAKAERAGAFGGMGLAKKVHASFEKAVQLEPSNVHALSDLGEYYVEAPGIVGGGLDKAKKIAAQLQQYSPSRAHRLLAMIAEKTKDYATAESEYKNAGSAPADLVALAGFYRKRGQTQAMLATINEAIAADKLHDGAIVDVASVLIHSQTSQKLAAQLLREYLASSAKSEETPAFAVHVRLGHLLAAEGNVAGAQQEFAAAHALARNYAPAIKAAGQAK